MNLSRITRLLQLLRLLQAGRGHNATSLAQACGVSRRTIFRDLDTLRSAGVPLEFDEQLQRYHIPGTYFLPPTNFTAEEALALIAMAHEIGERGNLPFYEPARTAALKLEGSLPPQLRGVLKSMTRAIRIKLPPVNPLDGQRPIYEQLVDAIARQKAVRIRYQSLTEWSEITSKLRPYQLLFSRHSWYVIGRSSIHRETRTFHVGRIRQLEPLDESFRVPRGFSVERYLRNAWQLIPEPGPDQEVRIRFQPLVAQNVAEVNWHKTQRIEFNVDGTLDFYATVSGLREISWWILGYGDQAEVLQPKGLRELVAQRVRKLMQRYDGSV
ncbi:MAG: WYL domain-containing protein [Pirellulales bacterium]